jgi:N-acetylglucosaminyldiphosphoundecaprenol N-acetyl-beta-D-mannosaminyltransferase
MAAGNDRSFVLGIQLSMCTEVELLDAIRHSVVIGSKMTVLSGNVHSFNLACQHQWLRSFFNKADIVRLDGVGVRLGAWILGFRTPSRVTWADFAWDLARYAELHGLTLFFLGGRPGVAERASEVLKTRFPDLRIVGTHHGYFDKAPGDPENESLVEQINAVRPDILIVGFGMPTQERWLLENWDRVEANVALTGGAVFDYVSGELRRAPIWMTDHGLEWLGRLLIEPRRLWKRYLVGNPLFLWRVVQQRFGWQRFEEE